MAKLPHAWVFLKSEGSLVGSRVTRSDRRNFPDYYRGVDIKFTYKTEGYLVSPNGQIWEARSGPYGKGMLPNGEYTIGRIVIPRRWGFKDGNGLAWFCPITPTFRAPMQKPAVGPPDVRGTERFGFGIHPDWNWGAKGAPIGTSGCIGITEKDTSRAKRALSNTHVRKLIVKDATEAELTSLLEV